MKAAHPAVPLDVDVYIGKRVAARLNVVAIVGEHQDAGNVEISPIVVWKNQLKTCDDLVVQGEIESYKVYYDE